MEMARILDCNGNEADRTVTVASLIELKAQNVQVAQVTASSADEAAAAEASGIEMVV
jgi:3-methyl-2-oxobutanoate hydroxymethyltransferase